MSDKRTMEKNSFVKSASITGINIYWILINTGICNIALQIICEEWKNWCLKYTAIFYEHYLISSQVATTRFSTKRGQKREKKITSQT